MGEKLLIGPNLSKGLRNDRTAFVIDNDSFPTLVNAYQWRGRVKRKRGTRLVNRLNRWIPISLSLSGGAVNLISALGLGSIATIVPGSISVVGGMDGTTYTDPNSNGILVATGGSGTGGTINYSTGVLTIAGGGAETITGFVYYYPDLPVMGLREFVTESSLFPISIAFDTTYAYEISSTYNAAGGNSIWDISYYKNPATGTYPSYVEKATNTPLTWNGANYQQFWTTNFQGSMWATNGVPGMQYERPGNVTATWVNATTMTFSIPAGTPAIVGDFIFVNEWVAAGDIPPDTTNSDTLNFQTGYVISGAGGPPFTSITVKFPYATITNDMYTNGIIQYLTTRKTTTVDGIRWLDGDPTNGGVYPATGSRGWVNYAPPLSRNTGWSIDTAPPGRYYLTGATLIYPFRDFLLFIGPTIQTSTGSPIYLQDTVIFAQNGTPFYTCSFTQPSVAFSISTVYKPILTPGAISASNLGQQTATASALWEDISGFGGYISSGVSQPILTLVPNEDVLILGYPKAFTRLIYTGNNLIPFLFYRINTELGASSTFSAITFDQGSFTLGNFGFAMTTQVSSQRIDLLIPDQAFQVNYANNGAQRISSGRNYYDEWVYTTYSSTSNPWTFPNQTVMYNYRDNSWAILNENYTTYGQFIIVGGLVWEAENRTWAEDDDTWNADPATVGSPNLIAGNQQGFVLIRDLGTGEGSSLYVQNISTTPGPTLGQITSPFHGFDYSDPISGAPSYVIFNNVIGTVLDENGNNINGNIYQVSELIDENTFTTSPLITGGTYLGGGTMTRAYVPFIQSKQFPLAWGGMKKTNLGPQNYLFTRTQNSQITLNLYLGTDPTTVYNTSTSNAIIYSQVLYTCPEATNLGLTPANVSLQQIIQVDSFGRSSNNQSQLWHRMNSAVLGDTVQFGFTLSPQQMLASVRSPSFNITAATKSNPCVLTLSGDFSEEFKVGTNVTISGVVGMVQLNGNDYTITALTPTTITINTDSTLFNAYSSGGTVSLVIQNNQFAEIEFHAAILDVKPSGLLA